MTFEEIKAGLLGLSAEELEEVRSRCALLLQGGAAPPPTASAAKPSRPQDADADIILEEISAFFREQGIEYAGVDKLRSMANYRSFAAKVPASTQYLNRVTRNRTKKRALIRLGVRMIYQDLQRMNVSASVRTLMNHWHRMPAVINRNFPGYAAAGLLGLLLHDGRANARYVYQEAESEAGEEHGN